MSVSCCVIHASDSYHVTYLCVTPVLTPVPLFVYDQVNEAGGARVCLCL